MLHIETDPNVGKQWLFTAPETYCTAYCDYTSIQIKEFEANTNVQVVSSVTRLSTRKQNNELENIFNVRLKKKT